MKTIEERAKLCSRDAAYQSCYDGYMKGATEQDDIRTKEAYQWFYDNWRKYIDVDADGMIRFSGYKNDYFKAMSL